MHTYKHGCCELHKMKKEKMVESICSHFAIVSINLYFTPKKRGGRGGVGERGKRGPNTLGTKK